MLELVRDTFTKNSTIGKMFLNGALLCDTLEDADRSGEDKILEADEKIYGETCIPQGTFNVILLYWPRYGCKMPHITNVPLYSELFIHPGNDKGSTLGCPLVGVRSPTQPDFIGNSRVTFFEKVLPKIHDWLDDHDRLYLTVRAA